MIELEFEITHLKEYNENLTTENYSLRSLLKDYEETKLNENFLYERLEKASIKEQDKEQEFELHVKKLTVKNIEQLKTVDALNEIIKQLRRKNKQSENEIDMKTGHLETKCRLLEEALNKRNDDIKDIEASNEELIGLLEK
jgi:hypothetical protein